MSRMRVSWRRREGNGVREVIMGEIYTVDFVVMILVGLNMQCDIYLGIMRINSGGKHKSLSCSSPSDPASPSINE